MTKIFFQASTPRKALIISFSSLLINKAHPQKWMSSWPCGQHHGDGQGRTIPGRVQHTWMVQSKCSCDSPHRQRTWMRDPLKGSTKGRRAQRLWLSTVSTLEFSSVSHSVMSDSLWPHEPQHPRPPCPSLAPGVHPNPCPLSWWCYPTISSSVIPFSSCPQSFSASGSFQMSQLFISGGRSIGISASTSILPVNTQDWSPLGWISLESKGLSRVFSNTTVQKH